jgi:predicted AlkP superfamily phosphohydrolase/phosphomutase
MLPFLVYSQTRPNKAINIANDVADGRIDLAKMLMSETDWDLAFLVLRITDTVQHFLWNNEELVLAMYKNIDQQLGEIREEFDDHNTVVLSDHGFRSADRTFYINNFLYNNGYLATNGNPNRNIKYAISNFGKELVKISSYAFPVEYLLENSITERFLSDTISKDIDFSATDAFCLSASASGVRVTAEDDRKAEIIAALVEDLRELCDPVTGEPVLDSVFTRKELYPDGNVEKAPDILFTLADQYTISDLIVPPELGLSNLVRSRGDLPVTTERLGYQHSGEHARNGVLLMNGPDVSAGRVSQRSLLDVLPTLLHAMEYPIPDDLDGSIIEEAFAGSQEANYVTLEERATTGTGGQSDDRVRERLQDLGYLG